MKISPKLIACLQAAGLTTYVLLVSLIMQNAQNWFGPQNDNQMFGFTIFLLIFIISALISSSIILGYPIILFFIKGKKKTALKIVLESILWLILFLALILAITLKSK